MGRKKGVKNKVKEEIKVEEAIPISSEMIKAIAPKQLKVARLTSDFGREDLNQLRDKVNELIDIVN